jgi:hypothetical protein
MCCKLDETTKLALSSTSALSAPLDIFSMHYIYMLMRDTFNICVGGGEIEFELVP